MLLAVFYSDPISQDFVGGQFTAHDTDEIESSNDVSCVVDDICMS